ncbi:MAG: HAD hydrolase-like protein [Candidatus Magasanikbacteria bacterium]
MLKAIIFDFDGVLGDTYAMNLEVCKIFKPHITDESFRDLHNGNVYKTQDLSFDKNEEIFHASEMKKRFEEKHLFPFKKDIEKLSKDYKLFVVSSTSEENLENYLRCGNLLSHFVAVLGKNTDRSKVVKFKMIFEKYNLLSEECLFFTDTLGDLREAEEVNLPAVGVTWGYHDSDTLQKGKTLRIISEFDEIVSTIEEFKHNFLNK